MFFVSSSVQVYLALGSTDMRKSINGLSLLVQGVLSARVREKQVNRCYHLGVKGLACLWQPCGRNTLLEHRGGVAVIPGLEILGRNY
jgi:hypothetical protein